MKQNLDTTHALRVLNLQVRVGLRRRTTEVSTLEELRDRVLLGAQTYASSPTRIISNLDLMGGLVANSEIAFTIGGVSRGASEFDLIHDELFGLITSAHGLVHTLREDLCKVIDVLRLYRKAAGNKLTRDSLLGFLERQIELVNTGYEVVGSRIEVVSSPVFHSVCRDIVLYLEIAALARFPNIADAAAAVETLKHEPPAMHRAVSAISRLWKRAGAKQAAGTSPPKNERSTTSPSWREGDWPTHAELLVNDSAETTMTRNERDPLQRARKEQTIEIPRDAPKIKDVEVHLEADFLRYRERQVADHKDHIEYYAFSPRLKAQVSVREYKSEVGSKRRDALFQTISVLRSSNCGRIPAIAYSAVVEDKLVVATIIEPRESLLAVVGRISHAYPSSLEQSDAKWRLACASAEALAAYHGLGGIHGAVSPMSFLVDRFGQGVETITIALPVDLIPEPGTREAFPMELSNILPEQIFIEPRSKELDVLCLGIVVFGVFADELLPLDTSGAEFDSSVRSLSDEYGRQLVALLRRSWSESAEDRPSASQFLEQLYRLSDAMQTILLS